MSLVGITGASGQLGQALMRRFPHAIPIAHRMPSERVDLLIHAACPVWTDEHSITEFDRFNLAVRQYMNTHPGLKMVNVGSWWQYAEGSCRDLSYTKLKDRQREMFPEATHLVAYSIYGDQKGFIKSVLDHITGGPRLLSVGTQWRDFIHVDDCAAAVEVAAGLTGTWAACTKEPVRTDALLRSFGIELPIVEQEPSAELAYRHPVISTGPNRVQDFMASTIAARARRTWEEQRNDWRAA